MKRAITGDQILQWQDIRKQELLLGEYLARGESMLFYAPTGHGKTVNALMLSIALTTGGKFYDWPVHRKIPLLFVEGGELTAYGIAQRARAIYKSLGITSDPNFHLKAPTKTEPFVYDITNPNHQAVLENYVDEYGIECVVFDNFNSLRGEGSDEFVSWSRLEKFLQKLKTKGVCTVVIHHTNKEAKQQSGGQRKADFADTVIRLQKSRLSTRESKRDTEGKLYVEVEMQKFRWGEAAPVILTELVFVGEDEIQMIEADYQDVLSQTISRDLLKYGVGYVRKKFDYLGYKLEHYINKPTHDDPVTRFDNSVPFDTNDFF